MDIPVYDMLNRHNICDLLKKETLPKKDWGDNCDDFTSADTTQKYLIEVMKQNSSNEYQYIMTGSMCLEKKILTSKNKNDEKINTEVLDYINKSLTILINTYKEIITNYGTNIFIFTMINASSFNISSSISHQNWICLDVTNNKLIRFEPSINYEEFKLDLLCSVLSQKIEADYIPYISELSHETGLYGCRLFSTLLTTMYIHDTLPDFDDLKKLKKSKKWIECLRKIIFIFNTEVSKYEKYENVNNRIIRNQPVLNYILISEESEQKKRKLLKFKTKRSSPKRSSPKRSSPKRSSPKRSSPKRSIKLTLKLKKYRV